MSALVLCDNVYIYGFGYDPRGFTHYYDKKPQKYWWEGHSLGAEEIFRDILIDSPGLVQPWSTWGLGKLHHGKPPIKKNTRGN